MLLFAGGALGYNDQKLTYRDYANMYYRDFLFYTREKRSAAVAEGQSGDAGLIMSRPVDCLLDGASKVKCLVYERNKYQFSMMKDQGSAYFANILKYFQTIPESSLLVVVLMMFTCLIAIPSATIIRRSARLTAHTM